MPDSKLTRGGSIASASASAIGTVRALAHRNAGSATPRAWVPRSPNRDTSDRAGGCIFTRFDPLQQHVSRLASFTAARVDRARAIAGRSDRHRLEAVR